MDQDSFIVDVTPFQDASLTPTRRQPSYSGDEAIEGYPGDGHEMELGGGADGPSFFPYPSMSSLLPMTPARDGEGGSMPSTRRNEQNVGDEALPNRHEDLHYIWGTNISEEEFRHDFRCFLETFETPVMIAGTTDFIAGTVGGNDRTRLSGRRWDGVDSYLPTEAVGAGGEPYRDHGEVWQQRLGGPPILGDSGRHAPRPRRVLYFIQELLQMYVEGRTILELDMTWVHAAAPQMFFNIVNQPTECGQMMNAVIGEMFHELIASRYGGRLRGVGGGSSVGGGEEEEEVVMITVAPKHMPQIIPLKALNPEHIETLISLKGMIIRVSKVIPEVRVACFECWHCLYTERSACGDRGRIFEPTRCPQCGKAYTFKLQHNLCLFEDKQLIKVQEAPENVADGETPITITVVVYGHMVDAVIPGDRVIITGVYRSMPLRLSSNTRSIKSVFSTHMDALHVDFTRASLSTTSTFSSSRSTRTTARRRNDNHHLAVGSATALGGSARGEGMGNDALSSPFSSGSNLATSTAPCPAGASSSLHGPHNDGGEDNHDHRGHHNTRGTEMLEPMQDGITDEESHRKDRLDMFYRIARREDIYDILLRSFSRSIWGHEDVKRGILCQLFGGTPKTFVFSRSATAGGTTTAAPFSPSSPISEEGRDPFLAGSSVNPSVCSMATEFLHTTPSSTTRGNGAGGPTNASNSANSRAEINVLLCGDPGVAKSQLLTQVHEVAPRGVYTSGKGSSSVGLTAFVVKDQETGDLVLEPGALVLSDKGLCCIDEFDKMNEVTRSVLLEVMEQQTLSIAKAGIIVQLNARTSLLAAANPKESQWNPLLNVVENLQIESTLLSRFDLIFLFLDRHDPAEDRRLAAHILSMYMEKEDGGSATSATAITAAARVVSEEGEKDEEEEDASVVGQGDDRRRRRRNNKASDPPAVLTHKGEVFLQGRPGDIHMPGPILSEYIAEARERVRPALTQASHEQLALSYVELRKARGNTRMVSATLRQLESMIRLAEARAKMRFSDTVTAMDVKEAKRLMSVALKEAATDPKTGLIRLDMFYSQEQNNNSTEACLQRLESFIHTHYIAAGKTSCTVVELRHALNELTTRPGIRPLTAGAFVELLSLAAGGDAVQSFTATNVVFSSTKPSLQEQ